MINVVTCYTLVASVAAYTHTHAHTHTHTHTHTHVAAVQEAQVHHKSKLSQQWHPLLYLHLLLCTIQA